MYNIFTGFIWWLLQTSTFSRSLFNFHLFSVIVNIGGALSVEAPPSWGDSYHVMGTLQLPYAEIEEPFEAYYDAKNKKSKVSYYGGNYILYLVFIEAPL